MTELIFLAGLLLSQATTNNGMGAPAGVLYIHEQPHVLQFAGQSRVDALHSVESALMMHARDASHYGLVRPVASPPGEALYELQVSRQGSVDDVQIRYSLARDADNRLRFVRFEMSAGRQPLDAAAYAQILTELRAGYTEHNDLQARPPLPARLPATATL